jgi:hypothetical protein
MRRPAAGFTGIFEIAQQRRPRAVFKKRDPLCAAQPRQLSTIDIIKQPSLLRPKPAVLQHSLFLT